MSNAMQGYWAGKGKHQAAYDKLWDTLVPACGEAETKHGEAIRAISRLSHETYNNGCGNMFEDKYDDGYAMSSYYDDLICTVDDYLFKAEVGRHQYGVKEQLKRAHRGLFDRVSTWQEFAKVFEPIMNRVVICAAGDEACTIEAYLRQ